MGQGKFEALLAEKFNQAEGIAPPPSVWARIDSILNVSLISSFSKKNRIYKVLSIAAMLIALISISNKLFFDISKSDSNQFQGESFNALTKGEYYSYSNATPEIANNFSTYQRVIFVGSNDRSDEVEIIESDTEFPLEPFVNKGSKNEEYYGFLTSLRSVEVAKVSDGFYAYSRPNYSDILKKKSKSKNKFWAGLDASRGSFNPEFEAENSALLNVNSGQLATVSRTGFSNPTAEARQNTMNEGVSRSLGMNFGLALGRKWSLESGIAYSSMESDGIASLNVLDVFSSGSQFRSIAKEDLRDVKERNSETSSANSSIDVQESYESEVEMNNNFQFASIPLRAGYSLMNRKFMIRVNAGLAANYLVGNQTNDRVSGEVLSGNSSEINEWFFDGMGGVEFGYTISRKVNFTLEPNYRQSLTPLSNSLQNQSGFNLRTGIRYIIK